MPLPPVWLAVSVAAIVLLHFALPLARVIPAPWHWLGAVIVLLGAALVAWVSIMFGRANTTIVPREESSTLVTSGPFQLSRNPIYLGMALILLGECIFFGSLTPFLVVPAFMILIQQSFIVPIEERM